MKFDFLNSCTNSGRAFTVSCFFLITLIFLALIFSEMNFGKSSGSSVLAMDASIRLLPYLSFTERICLGICLACKMANNRQSSLSFSYNSGFLLLLGLQCGGRWPSWLYLTLCATQLIKTKISLPLHLHLWHLKDNDNLPLSVEGETHFLR